MFRLVVLCALLTFVRGETTNVSECTLNPAPLPINQYVVGCIEPPCLLPQLEDVVINVIFTAPRTLNNMRTLATATINFGIVFDINYDLGTNAVTCNFFTNTYCPLLPGEVVQYSLRMHIERFFPVGTSAIIEFRVVDEAEVPLWCIRVPIRIEPPAVTADAVSTRSNGTLEVFV